MKNFRTSILALMFLAGAAITASAQVPAFLEVGLVAWYPFNGNARDASGSGKDGVLLAGAEFAKGRFEGDEAVRVDGVNGLNKGARIDTPLVNAGQPQYSINIWFESDNTAKTYQTLINTDPHAGLGVGFNRDGTKRIGMLIGSGPQWITPFVYSIRTFPDAKWRMVTLVKIGDLFSLFVDGELEGTVSTPTSAWSIPLSFWIGSIGPIFPGAIRPGEVFAGLLDDLRIYNRALSNAEVKSLYEYEKSPQDQPSRPATAVAQVVNGFLVGATVTDPGYGYSEPPVVLIRGGNGSGATAVATVENGIVTGITISNPGSGYTGALRISIASPPFAPRVSISVSRVSVTQNVVLGRKYLLESSTALGIWSPVGAPFVAESEETVQEFVVAEVGQFFRIRQVP